MNIVVYTLLTFSLLFGWEYYNNGRLETLEPLASLSRDATVKYFKTSRNITLGVAHQIIVKPKNSRCKDKLLKQYPDYSLLPNGDIVFSLQTPQEAFKVAKKIYESGCVYFSHPDFLLFPKKRSFDPLFIQQWNFLNRGQDGIVPGVDLDIYEAWQYATGKGVKVALIDNGFDLLHPDLQGGFVDQIDLVDYDLNASFNNKFEVHGTACAGLVAARKNGVGVQGAAFDASLIAIKLIGSYPSGEDRALYVSNIVRAFWYAKNSGADVINCSWGTYSVADAVRDVIDDVAYNGRDGKGIPIVFASGNEGRGQWYWTDDESALPSVIAVGAITDQGDVAWYSNYGPALDFVAPSGGGLLRIATTDVRGPLGYADGSFGHPDYCYATDFTGFNGTSAAAPQVSGVIALMLQRNPELTRDEVVEILRKTAKKVGTIPYINGRNDYMGYGLVDADDAVKEAIRRFVTTKIQDNSFSIAGYFIRIGQGVFDWVYVSADRKLVAKLDGMEHNGSLKWRPLLWNAFEDIEITSDRVIFGATSATDTLAQRLASRSFVLEGYFIHYGPQKYDWIYVDRARKKSYKLEGLSYTKHFLWVELPVEVEKKGKKIFFKTL